MNFTDIPDDTLDDNDFAEIGDDNSFLFSSLEISNIDFSLLEKILDLDIPLEMDDIVASDTDCEIIRCISQNEDESFLGTFVPDLEGRTISPKK